MYCWCTCNPGRGRFVQAMIAGPQSIASSKIDRPEIAADKSQSIHVKGALLFSIAYFTQIATATTGPAPVERCLATTGAG